MLSPIERSLLATLGDCRQHSQEELCACIDSQADNNNLKVAIHRLRKKIEGAGYTISFSGGGYRLVKFATLPLYGLKGFLA